MTNEEPKSMKEIHAIREELHNETKDMAIREKMLYFHKKAEAFKSKYKLKMKRNGQEKKKAVNE